MTSWLYIKKESTWGDTGAWTRGSNSVLGFCPNILSCLKHRLANTIQMSVLLRATGECWACEIPDWLLVKTHDQCFSISRLLLKFRSSWSPTRIYSIQIFFTFVHQKLRTPCGHSSNMFLRKVIFKSQKNPDSKLDSALCQPCGPGHDALILSLSFTICRMGEMIPTI